MRQNQVSPPPDSLVEIQAATSLLTVRYPAALDTPPSVLDDVTPLSGVLMNYLGLMLEAIQAEAGPLHGVVDYHGSLLRFLGYQLNNRLSCWRSFGKAYGGDEAGQVFGLIKRYHSGTGSAFNTAQLGSATSNQGAHPTTKQPLVFGEAPQMGGGTAQQVIDSVGGGVRGRANWTGASSIDYSYRGSTAKLPPSGASSGAHTQGVHLLLFFPYEASQ